jgi:hypothetical protein
MDKADRGALDTPSDDAPSPSLPDLVQRVKGSVVYIRAVR